MATDHNENDGEEPWCVAGRVYFDEAARFDIMVFYSRKFFYTVACQEDGSVYLHTTPLTTLTDAAR